MLKISHKSEGSKATIVLDGALVAGSVEDARMTLKQIIATPVSAIELDMTAVASVDSAGVGFLAAVHNSLKKSGGVLRVTGLSKEMFLFFSSLRLNAHFAIEERKQSG